METMWNGVQDLIRRHHVYWARSIGYNLNERRKMGRCQRGGRLGGLGVFLRRFPVRRSHFKSFLVWYVGFVFLKTHHFCSHELVKRGEFLPPSTTGRFCFLCRLFNVHFCRCSRSHYSRENCVVMRPRATNAGKNASDELKGWLMVRIKKGAY